MERGGTAEVLPAVISEVAALALSFGQSFAAIIDLPLGRATLESQATEMLGGAKT